MTSDLWRAGDKVRLTGTGWRRGEFKLKAGDICTLEYAVSPRSWAIEEGDREANGGPIQVYVATTALFAAEKVEDGPLSTPTEVRTTSSTGGEKGVKPEAYALIPWEAMDEVARVYEFGARKYADHNWRKGYEWGKSFSALCRHIFAFWKGEDRDPESGLSHLAHATFHTLGILSFWLDKERYGKFDDRYRP